MDWYLYIIIAIVTILLLTLLMAYICYKLTFYSNKEKNILKEEITLPNNDMFNEFKDQIINDIKEVRTYNYQDFYIYSYDGLKLHGKYYQKHTDAPIEIMFHGYKGSGERDLSTGVKRAFLCGRNALVIDQRASGLSEGKTITFGIKERYDCVSWVNFVTKHFGENQKIILTGISMGAATVMLASSMNLPKNVIGVLADCGYNKASDIIKKVIKDMKLPPNIIYPFIKLGAIIFGRFNPDETSPYESIKKTTLPIIFIHGSSDDFVPHNMSEKLYNACNSKKRLVSIKDGKHGTSYFKDSDTYIKELNEFFK